MPPANCASLRPGTDGIATELERVVALAREVGIAPLLVDLLSDPTQPELARCRAFVHVRAALVATVPSPWDCSAGRAILPSSV